MNNYSCNLSMSDYHFCYIKFDGNLTCVQFFINNNNEIMNFNNYVTESNTTSIPEEAMFLPISIKS